MFLPILLKNLLTAPFKQGDNSYYKKDAFIDNCIYQYLEFYLLKMMNYNNSKNINLLYKKFIEKIFNMRKYNLDKESFFIELKTKIFNG